MNRLWLILHHNAYAPAQTTDCPHLDSIVEELEPCVDHQLCQGLHRMNSADQETFMDDVARKNVIRSVQEILARSEVIRNLSDAGKVLVVGALYDVKSGKMEFLMDEPAK